MVLSSLRLEGFQPLSIEASLKLRVNLVGSATELAPLAQEVKLLFPLCLNAWIKLTL
jgi:hypothetical protein